MGKSWTRIATSWAAVFLLGIGIAGAAAAQGAPERFPEGSLKLSENLPQTVADPVAGQTSVSGGVAAAPPIAAQKLIKRKAGKGRLVAMEVMKNIPAISNLIRKMTFQHMYSTMQTQSAQGLITLERHLRDLIESGDITREAALAAANVPSAIS